MSGSVSLREGTYYDYVGGYDQNLIRVVLLDLWVDAMQLLFLHYLKNSMLPILLVLYITINRKTRILLHQHQPRKVYIIIHSTSNSRLCNSMHNSMRNNNKRVALRGRRQAGAGVITRTIKITTQNISRPVGLLVMPLRVAAAILPPGLHAVPALALVHRLNRTSPMSRRI
jgi:hypothetical protein